MKKKIGAINLQFKEKRKKKAELLIRYGKQIAPGLVASVTDHWRFFSHP